jgi:transposase-like protein
MNTLLQFCPKETCSARGQTGQGNITIHDRQRQRYRCRTCGHTFSARRGTMLEGLRKPSDLIVIVVTLLAYGCPIQAIVHAYGLDERTVASWRDRAGEHSEKVHQAIVVQRQLDLQHVQADEVRAKGRGMVVWMAMALMVSTRLWLGGVVSLRRDRTLADRLLMLVRACAHPLGALLICTDGWAPYPKSILRAFREKVKGTGKGRPPLQVWPELVIGRVVKHTKAMHVVKVSHDVVRGTMQEALSLLKASCGGTMLNTAYIERFNATLRERLASLTRRCRHAAQRLHALHTGMYLIGCTYNLCWPHDQLREPLPQQPGQRHWRQRTPAMAAGLTDHIWSMYELLTYKVAPAPWVPPKRRGRPRKVIQGPIPPKRPRGRPRKMALVSPTG